MESVMQAGALRNRTCRLQTPEVLVIRVLLVSDVRLYRDGLAQCLAQHDRLDVVGMAGSGAEALDIASRHRPDIVLLDMGMASSVQLVRVLREVTPGAKVVAYAVAGDESDVISYAEAGVAGYVARDGSALDLVRAIQSVADGELICSPQVAAKAFHRLAMLSAATQASTTTTLTMREREIVALIAEGLSNKQIARRLTITLATVKHHVHNVLEKLQVARRGEAVVAARTRLLFPN
jgi:DNA-binding NarL/FixJ family response regulator